MLTNNSRPTLIYKIIAYTLIFLISFQISAQTASLNTKINYTSNTIVDKDTLNHFLAPHTNSLNPAMIDFYQKIDKTMKILDERDLLKKSISELHDEKLRNEILRQFNQDNTKSQLCLSLKDIYWSNQFNDTYEATLVLERMGLENRIKISRKNLNNSKTAIAESKNFQAFTVSKISEKFFYNNALMNEFEGHEKSIQHFDVIPFFISSIKKAIISSSLLFKQKTITTKPIKKFTGVLLLAASLFAIQLSAANATEFNFNYQNGNAEISFTPEQWENKAPQNETLDKIALEISQKLKSDNNRYFFDKNQIKKEIISQNKNIKTPNIIIKGTKYQLKLTLPSGDILTNDSLKDEITYNTSKIESDKIKDSTETKTIETEKDNKLEVSTDNNTDDINNDTSTIEIPVMLSIASNNILNSINNFKKITDSYFSLAFDKIITNKEKLLHYSLLDDIYNFKLILAGFLSTFLAIPLFKLRNSKKQYEISYDKNKGSLFLIRTSSPEKDNLENIFLKLYSSFQPDTVMANLIIDNNNDSSKKESDSKSLYPQKTYKQGNTYISIFNLTEYEGMNGNIEFMLEKSGKLFHDSKKINLQKKHLKSNSIYLDKIPDNADAMNFNSEISEANVKSIKLSIINLSIFLTTFVLFTIYTTIPPIGAIVIAFYIFHHSMLIGIICNEIGHLITGSIFLRNWITKKNITANISPLMWVLNFLVPFFGFYFFKKAPHVKIDNFENNKIFFAKYFKSNSIESFIRVGGLVLGTAFYYCWYLALNKIIILLPENLAANTILFSVMGISGIFVSFILSCYSDLKKIQIPWNFFCGNFGLMLSTKILNNKKSIEIIQPMIQTTAIRGKQAGGIATITNNSSTLFKVVNSKRGRLDSKLISNLKKVLIPQKNNTMLLLGHVRYGTSSAPSIEATHPHTFSGENERVIWNQNSSGNFTKTKVKLVNYITHNGDYTHHNFSKHFNFGKSFEKVDLNITSQWLRNVLNPNNAPGDSVHISGMIELYHTQKMWLPSFRLAFYQILAKDFNDFISRKELKEISILADEIMEFVSNDTNFNMEKDIKFIEESIIDSILKNVNSFKKLQKYSSQDIQSFAKQTISNFLNADLFDAVHKFSESSMGTFGMFAASSIYPDRIVAYAKGQPLAIGFSESGLVAWGSEPAALKILDEKENPLFRYHYYMDEIGGEVVELKNNINNNFISFRGISHMKGPINDKSSLIKTGRLVDTKDNPLINPLRKYENADIIETDLMEISDILKNIQKSFADNKSFNNKTGIEFSNAIFERIKSPPPSALNQDLDVLIIGEETSLFHAEAFASSLSKLFPLNVRAVSSNTILSTDSNIDILNKKIRVDNSKGSGFTITGNTVVLAVSHSGQTFSTFHVTNLLSKMVKNVFAITGEIDSQIGRAIGQKYYKGADFSKRIFTNMAGYRPSEASTVSSVATNYTLTEILLLLLEQTRDNYPALKVRNKLSNNELDFIKKERELLIQNEIPSFTDTNSKKMKTIKKEAKRWGMDIIEPEIVLLSSISLVFISVLLGISPIPFLAFFSCLGFFVQFYKFLKKEVSFLKMSCSLLITLFISMIYIYHPYIYGLNISDAIIYSTLAFSIPLLLRLVQNRHLFDRIFGTRNLVISDSPPVQKLLHSFVSKLFASSYEIAGIITHSSKPNNIPHFFGHQVARGGRTWIGINRKSFASLIKEVGARSMNVNQILGIKNLSGGAEVITFGHDNNENSEFLRHINISSNKDKEIKTTLTENMERWNKIYDFSEDETTKLESMLTSNLQNFYGSFKEPYLTAQEITKRVFKERDESIKYSILKDIANYLEGLRNMENFIESRFDNLLRYISGILFFNSMAEFVANPPWYLFPLRLAFSFFRWLSHNGTRIATTASPQSADDILNIVEILERNSMDEENKKPANKKQNNSEKVMSFQLNFDNQPNKSKPKLSSNKVENIEINLNKNEDRNKNIYSIDLIPDSLKIDSINIMNEIFPSSEKMKLLEEIYTLLPSDWEKRKEALKHLLKSSKEESKKILLYFSLRTAIIPKWKRLKEFKKFLIDFEIDGESSFYCDKLIDFEKELIQKIKVSDMETQKMFIKSINQLQNEYSRTLKVDYKHGLKDFFDKLGKPRAKNEQLQLNKKLQTIERFSDLRPGIITFFMFTQINRKLTNNEREEICLFSNKNVNQFEKAA